MITMLTIVINIKGWMWSQKCNSFLNCTPHKFNIVRLWITWLYPFKFRNLVLYHEICKWYVKGTFNDQFYSLNLSLLNVNNHPILLSLKWDEKWVSSRGAFLRIATSKLPFFSFIYLATQTRAHNKKDCTNTGYIIIVRPWIRKSI